MSWSVAKNSSAAVLHGDQYFLRRGWLCQEVPWRVRNSLLCELMLFANNKVFFQDPCTYMYTYSFLSEKLDWTYQNSTTMYKGAILTSATVPWHGLIFCLERLPRNIVYKPRWSSTIEASEVALVVFTADWRPWRCHSWIIRHHYKKLQNSNKPPLFSPKFHFLRLFWRYLEKKCKINWHQKTLIYY